MCLARAFILHNLSAALSFFLRMLYFTGNVEHNAANLLDLTSHRKESMMCYLQISF